MNPILKLRYLKIIKKHKGEHYEWVCLNIYGYVFFSRTKPYYEDEWHWAEWSVSCAPERIKDFNITLDDALDSVIQIS